MTSRAAFGGGWSANVAPGGVWQVWRWESVGGARAWAARERGRRQHRVGPIDRLRPLGYAPAALPPGGRQAANGACGAIDVAGGSARRDRDETRAGGGEPGLAEVRVGENETFESALRRFNKKIQQSGILAEARRREHYEKPSVKRKRKEAKRKKNARTQAG